MALNFKQATAAINAAAAAVTALLNSGTIKIYSGIQPANPEVAIGIQVLLATLTYGVTAYGVPVAGVATANAIASGVAAATNTATWFRAFKSDATTPVCDGSVGLAVSDLILDNVSIISGGTVAISSLTYTVPGA